MSAFTKTKFDKIQGPSKSWYLSIIIAVILWVVGVPRAYAGVPSEDVEADFLASVVSAQCYDTTDSGCVAAVIGDYLGTDDVNVAIRQFPFLGEGLVVIKAINPQTNELFHMVISSEGEYLSDNGVEIAEKQRAMWINKWGKVTKQLLDIMQDTPLKSKIRVGIWLRMQQDPLDLSKANETSPLGVDNSAMLANQAQEEFLNEAAKQVSPSSLDFQAYLGTPAMLGELTIDQIKVVSSMKSVAIIYYAPAPSPTNACDTSWTWVQTVGSDLVEQYYGYDGSNQTVCVIEDCYPDDFTYLLNAGTYYTGANSCSFWHAKAVSATIANTYPGGWPNGTAEAASSYFANWAGTPAGNISDPIYNGCRSNSYRIWNFSHTTGDFDDRYFDYWVKHQPYPLITIGSANSSSSSCDTYGGQYGVVSPSSFNTMIVNASQDANTINRTDDTLAAACDWYGCWRNPCPSSEWCPYGDRELPLISAPGHHLTVMGSGLDGTSFAAPMVAGASALIHEESPALKTWPEAVRAILMATATNDINWTFFSPENSSVDESDGAGELNAFVAATLAASSHYKIPLSSSASTLGYGYGSIIFSGQCPRGYCPNHYYSIKGNSNGLPVRVVLTFDSTASCTDASSEASCASDHLDGDLDLLVRDNSTGVIIAHSYSYDNSVEMVQFTPASSQNTYRIEIWVGSHAEYSTWYGLAWLTADFVDNP